MAKRALTATQVSGLKAHGVHWIAPSLYLQIRPQGTRSWLFRYSRNGQNQWMGLGSLADKPLSEARDEAAVLRAQIKRGADPIGQKQILKEAAMPKKKIPTFAECADTYIESHRAGWKSDKHADQWPSTIKMYANPVIGKLPVDRVTVEHVLKILQPIWVEKPETASRLRGRIEKILGWASAMGHRGGDNSAAWKGGALSHLLPPISKVQKIEHHASVAYSEVPKVVTALMENGSLAARALVFLVLTAARTGEVLGATWDEVDLEGKLWTVPAERMKASREHRVPLSEPAVTLLKRLEREGRYVFPGSRPRKPLSNMTMLKALRAVRDDGVTVHGFRSSFSTWAREQTDYPREIVEASLAHLSGDAVELAYRRTDFIDKRRALMDEWAEFCNAPIRRSSA